MLPLPGWMRNGVKSIVAAGYGPSVIARSAALRAHLFVCLLAGYVEWHLRRALAPLLFDDETLHQARRTRDPVATAKPTLRAREKKARRRTDDGLAPHSLDTLLAEHHHGADHRWRGSEISASGHLEGMQRLDARIGARFWFHVLSNRFISAADRDLLLPASLTKLLGEHSRPQDVTEGCAADWTMEQLRDAAQHMADKIDEFIRAGGPAPVARAA